MFERAPGLTVEAVEQFVDFAVRFGVGIEVLLAVRLNSESGKSWPRRASERLGEGVKTSSPEGQGSNPGPAFLYLCVYLPESDRALLVSRGELNYGSLNRAPHAARRPDPADGGVAAGAELVAWIAEKRISGVLFVSRFFGNSGFRLADWDQPQGAHRQ